MMKHDFGTTSKGETVSKYEIKNSEGMKVVLTDFGAAVASIFVKDRNGEEQDVVLAYQDVAGYEESKGYFGETVGRYANRIEDAKVTIDGIEYALDPNDKGNNLHSGSQGVSLRVWNVVGHKDNEIVFETVSKDLEQGFPGNCIIRVTYTVTEENELKISYHAVSDKATMINLTNHSYFNLAGHNNGTILHHELKLYASYYTPIRDGKAIPTGEFAPVKGTPFDFTVAKEIGRDIDQKDDQLLYGNGYDHNFIIDKGPDQGEKQNQKQKEEQNQEQKDGQKLEQNDKQNQEQIVDQECKEGIVKEKDGCRIAAEAYCKESGICMQTYTDMPGVQLYSGNYLGTQIGKGGVAYQKRDGFCLETQYFPNSAKEPAFQKPLFKAEEACDTVTIYRFFVR